MATFKLVINDPSTGKSFNFEVTGHHAQNFLGNLAGVVCPAVAGLIVERTGHFAGAFAVTALVAAGGATAWLALVGQAGAIEWDSAMRNAEHGTQNEH